MQDFRVATFLEACRTMNYTRTAENLGLTQPAVSQHIAYLEHHYGVELFAYHNRKLALTAAGEELRRALITSTNDERILQERLEDLDSGSTVLRLGATLTAGEYKLVPLLVPYLESHPETTLQLVSDDTARLLDALETGRADLALVEGFFDRGKYGWKVLSSEPFCCVCSADHPVPDSPVALDELLGEHLVTREEGSGTRALLEQMLARANLTLEGFEHRSEVEGIGPIKQLVTGGCGITFLYRCAVEEELTCGRLREIPLAGGDHRHDLTFVWRRGSAFEDGYRTFIDDLTGATNRV